MDQCAVAIPVQGGIKVIFWSRYLDLGIAFPPLAHVWRLDRQERLKFAVKHSAYLMKIIWRND